MTVSTTPPTVEQAYRYCVAVTQEQARNFYFGIRLLPRARRLAMCAVYAFARRVDDIGDEQGHPDEKLAALARARQDLRRLDAPLDVATLDPVLVALRDAAQRLPLPLHAFHDLIDGVDMDLRQVAYESFPDLVRYCRRVAGSIGRMTVGVLGSRDPDRASELADDLGVALQLTNVLRDVREDLSMGRVYLPGEDLRRFGIGPGLEGAPAQLAQLVAFEARRAHDWYERGLALQPLLDRAGRACVGTMAGIYRQLLHRITAQPEAVWAGRVALPAREKAWVAARSMTGRTR